MFSHCPEISYAPDDGGFFSTVCCLKARIGFDVEVEMKGRD